LSRPRSARDQQAVMTFSEPLIKNPNVKLKKHGRIRHGFKTLIPLFKMYNLN